MSVREHDEWEVVMRRVAEDLGVAPWKVRNALTQEIAGTRWRIVQTGGMEADRSIGYVKEWDK